MALFPDFCPFLVSRALEIGQYTLMLLNFSILAGVISLALILVGRLRKIEERFLRKTSVILAFLGILSGLISMPAFLSAAIASKCYLEFILTLLLICGIYSVDLAILTSR